jgi:hypothetical protein
VVADPDRRATLVPALSRVTVVGWLKGGAVASPEVKCARLATFAEHLVDTPVRGLIYEAAGSVDGDVLASGAQIVCTTSQTWHIPAEVVTADPATHEEWLRAMKNAVERTLAGAGARG